MFSSIHTYRELGIAALIFRSRGLHGPHRTLSLTLRYGPRAPPPPQSPGAQSSVSHRSGWARRPYAEQGAVGSPGGRDPDDRFGQSSWPQSLSSAWSFGNSCICRWQAGSPGALCMNVTLVSLRKESPHAGSTSPEQVISLLHIGFLSGGAETLSVPGSSWSKCVSTSKSFEKTKKRPREHC